jgi:hypothetical protein
MKEVRPPAGCAGRVVAKVEFETGVLGQSTPIHTLERMRDNVIALVKEVQLRGWGPGTVFEVKYEPFDDTKPSWTWTPEQEAPHAGKGHNGPDVGTSN